jgi:radical SAM superfamily enzyme YgiQ (UPF0313 family)
MKYALPFIGKKASLPPLGLVTVAAMLPADYELTLVDMNVEPLLESAVARADIVFTSSMIVQKESLAQVVGMCNRLGKPVVAGGPYPTSCHDQIPGVDHFVLDEAEVTLPPFLRDLASGRAKPLYSSRERPSLALTPLPRFDLLKRKRYAGAALQYSRGCPHSCEFCDIIELFGRRPRTKAPDQLLRELELLYTGGWRGSLFLVDDNFIGNRKEVKALLPALALWQRQRHYPFALFTEASLDLANDDQLIDGMVQAGFNMVFMGIETPDRAALQAAGKQQNLKADMLSSIRKTQRAGLEVTGGFILGFDSDREDIFGRQVRFIQEAAIPTAMVGLLTALPRTQLHRRLQAEGRLAAETVVGNNTHDLRLSFIPKMDPRTLIEGYQRVLAEIYAPDRYFGRCLDLLKILKRHKTSTRRIGFAEIRALGRSLLIQTFSSYSRAYWKFLVKGLFTRPLMAPEVVTMAVKGHHFFRMTRSLLELGRFQGALERQAKAFEERLHRLCAGGQPVKLAELKLWRSQLLEQMRTRYRRLHKDFRSYADEAVARFQGTVDGIIERYSMETAAAGT